ncbi:MAG: B12-binding domain-containing radical SAM protein, partial [Deltaproteobacteria bacterium]|nr:B12-binding domain-containing radical SAM protein [Deltaproteobacteria bacterium]
MKILLLQNSPFVTHRSWNYLEHLGLGFLEKVLRDHDFLVDVFDATWNWDDVGTAVKRARPPHDPYDLLGFSVNRSNFTATAETIKKLRARGFKGHIVLGGYFPTFHFEKILRHFPEIDSIVLGHGENTFLRLCQNLRDSKSAEDIPGLAFRSNQKDIHFSPNFETEAFLSTVGIPVHRPRYGVARMITSRGCYWRCSFCCINAFDRYNFKTKHYRRKLDEVLEEVDLLVNHHQVNHIWFSDMEFIGRDQDFIRDFCDHIIKKRYNLTFEADCRVDSLNEPLVKKLSKAGFAALFLGVESFADRQTDDYNKFKKDFNKNDIFKTVAMLKKYDITPRFGFIMFDKNTTCDELRLNHEVISTTVGYGTLDGLANKLAVLPGTKIESEYIKDSDHCFQVAINKNNRLKPHLYYMQYEFQDPQVRFLYEVSFSYRNKIIRLQELFDSHLKKGSLSYGKHTAILWDLRDLFKPIFDRLLSLIKDASPPFHFPDKLRHELDD